MKDRTETFTAIEYEGDLYLYRPDDNTAISFYTISLFMDLYNEDPEELERIVRMVEERLTQLRVRAEA